MGLIKLGKKGFAKPIFLALAVAILINVMVLLMLFIQTPIRLNQVWPLFILIIIFLTVMFFVYFNMMFNKTIEFHQNYILHTNGRSEHRSEIQYISRIVIRFREEKYSYGGTALDLLALGANFRKNRRRKRYSQSDTLPDLEKIRGILGIELLIGIDSYHYNFQNWTALDTSVLIEQLREFYEITIVEEHRQIGFDMEWNIYPAARNN